MTHAIGQCDRPWWKRPPVWFIAAAAGLALLAGVVIEGGVRRTALPYGGFLDQLDDGNVASVTFHGTEITGRFKHAVESGPANGPSQPVEFLSRIPEFGDPSLIPELRRQHVVIDVAASWTRLLSALPWPMLLLMGAMLVAAAVRLVRGGPAKTESAATMHPMAALVARLFAPPRSAPPPTPPPGDMPKAG